MSDLTKVQQDDELQALINKSYHYISNAKAANTLKSYRADWRDFTDWCKAHNLPYLPAQAEVVVTYLTQLTAKGRKMSTLKRRISAISQAHQAAGFSSPTHSLPVRAALAGIKREIGSMQQGKAPILIEDLRAMIETISTATLIGLRDRALLLVGFAGAFRRSELVSLNVEDITFSREGLIIMLRHSKTDQAGQGRKIGIPYGHHADTCPVKAVQQWLEASHLSTGALFRPINRHGHLQTCRLSDKAVSLIIKRYARAAGLNADKYAGHSLRAGLATTAAIAGVNERAIMQQTGHRSAAMVRRYIRDGSLFRNNPAAFIDL